MKSRFSGSGRSTSNRMMKLLDAISPLGTILLPVKNWTVVAGTETCSDCPRMRSVIVGDVRDFSIVGQEMGAPRGKLSHTIIAGPSRKCAKTAFRRSSSFGDQEAAEARRPRRKTDHVGKCGLAAAALSRSDKKGWTLRQQRTLYDRERSCDDQSLSLVACRHIAKPLIGQEAIGLLRIFVRNAARLRDDPSNMGSKRKTASLTVEAVGGEYPGFRDERRRSDAVTRKLALAVGPVSAHEQRM